MFLAIALEKLFGKAAPVIEFPAEPSEDVIEPVQATADVAVDQQARLAEAARSEKERMRAILESDEARGRTRQAGYIATETDLTVEAAKAILGLADREVTCDAPPQEDFFARHMRENLELWAPQAQISAADTIARIRAAYAFATGTNIEDAAP